VRGQVQKIHTAPLARPERLQSAPARLVFVAGLATDKSDRV